MDESVREKRTCILHAAEKLFRHFGFGKTTMAEIAKDCDMSAANIYRFYESKDDILAELARNHFSAIEEALRNIVRKQDISSAEKLDQFVCDMHSMTTDVCETDPKLIESVEYIQKKRPDLINRHAEARRALLAEIISEGNSSGEFAVDDVIRTAEVIHWATDVCDCHWDLCKLGIENKDTVIKETVRLLVNGIAKK